MCDRWLGHLLETLRTQGRLDDTLVVVTSDHGHSLWERRGYIGKRGYPSDPEVLDVPLLVRHPQGWAPARSATPGCSTTTSAPTILEAAASRRPNRLMAARSADGCRGGAAVRDHVIVGWGSAMTVMTDRWWFNCKVDGRGALLLRPRAARSLRRRASPRRSPPLVRELFARARPRHGGFPDYLLELAETRSTPPAVAPSRWDSPGPAGGPSPPASRPRGARPGHRPPG